MQLWPLAGWGVLIRGMFLALVGTSAFAPFIHTTL
jgi:hypothetical protein